MARLGVLVVLLSSSIAAADRPEPPVQFELGINTRRFTAAPQQETAFRGGESDPTMATHTALTADLRFTRWLPWNTFFGVEGEVGRMPDYEGSNLAGAYGVVGARGDLGFTTLAVELASGWRSVRYSLESGTEEQGKFVVEPRVRATMWASERVTIGAAIGSTLGERSVFMGGLYVGVHSLVWGKKKP
jgi:hypothetical protein